MLAHSFVWVVSEVADTGTGKSATLPEGRHQDQIHSMSELTLKVNPKSLDFSRSFDAKHIRLYDRYFVPLSLDTSQVHL